MGRKRQGEHDPAVDGNQHKGHCCGVGRRAPEDSDEDPDAQKEHQKPAGPRVPLVQKPANQTGEEEANGLRRQLARAELLYIEIGEATGHEEQDQNQNEDKVAPGDRLSRHIVRVRS